MSPWDILVDVEVNVVGFEIINIVGFECLLIISWKSNLFPRLVCFWDLFNIDQATSQSAQLKEEVAEAQETLVAITKGQAEMDTIRQEQNANYKQAKADLEAGVAGVEKALAVLRDYYGGASAAAMIQQGDWSASMRRDRQELGFWYQGCNNG